jgi:hypothetical protein
MLVLAITAYALIQSMVQATSATALKATLAILTFLMDAKVGIGVLLVDAFKHFMCHFSILE